MKKQIALICTVFIIALYSCNSTPEGYQINGELRGDIENGTQVFLKTTDSLQRSMIDVDTTTVENGLFSFSGKANGFQLYYLVIDGIQGNSPLVLENGEIIFKAQKDSIAFAQIKGTEQNDIFMNYIEESRKFAAMSKTFNDDFRKASAERDTAAVESLRAEYLELQEKAKNFEQDFVKENPTSLIAAFMLEKIVNMKSLPIKEVEELYNNLSEEIKASKPGKRMKEQLNKAKATAVGTKAPDFSGPTPNGETLALNQVEGKLTLVDFLGRLVQTLPSREPKHCCSL